MTRIDDILEQLRTGALGATEAMLAIQKRLNESDELDAEELYRQVEEAHQKGLSSARAGRIRELIGSWFDGEAPGGDRTDDALAPSTSAPEEEDEFHLELEPVSDDSGTDEPEHSSGEDATPPPGSTESTDADAVEQSPGADDHQAPPPEEFPPVSDQGPGDDDPDRTSELPGQLPPGAVPEDDDEVILEAGGAGELTRNLNESDPEEDVSARTTTTMVGALLGGRYELLARISQDAYGTMFRARDHKSSHTAPEQQLCGIRVLPREANREDVRKRLQAIIRRTARLNHPGILPPREMEDDGQRTWLVTDQPKGNSLARFIRRKCVKGLHPDEALPMVRELGEALFAAHQEGVVHGDLRPSSIYISNEGGLQIADFGLRVALYGNTTPSGQAGTTEIEQMDPIDAYLTLEILESEPPEASDDIYALACIAATVLTGGHPFNGQSALRRMERDLRPPRIRRLTRNQNRALQRGMALYREKRPQHVLEFLEELETRRGSVPKAQIALAAGLTGLAVAGWFGFQYWSAEQSRTEQLEQVADAGWPAIRGELQGLDPSEREFVLAELEEEIPAIYRSGIEEALEDAEPDLAHSYLEELREWYPESGELAGMEDELEAARQEKITSLEEKLGALLESRELTEREEGRDLPTVVTRLDQLDANPEDAQLDELRTAYFEAADEAAAGAAPERAEALLEAATAIFSEDEQLRRHHEEAVREAERQASGERLSEIESDIEGHLPPEDLEALNDVRDQLAALIRIGGAHEWVDEHAETIHRLVEEAVEERVAVEDFAEANRILRQNAPILPTPKIQALRQHLNRAQSESGYRPPSVRAERQSLEERREMVESLLDDPQYTPSWTGELIIAWRETLAWRRPGQTWIDDLEDRMGDLFVERAEALRERGDTDQAREAARMGLYLAPDSDRLENLANNTD